MTEPVYRVSISVFKADGLCAYGAIVHLMEERVHVDFEGSFDRVNDERYCLLCGLFDVLGWLKLMKPCTIPVVVHCPAELLDAITVDGNTTHPDADYRKLHRRVLRNLNVFPSWKLVPLDADDVEPLELAKLGWQSEREWQEDWDEGEPVDDEAGHEQD